MLVIALALWTFADSCFHIQHKTVLTSHPLEICECSACSLEPVAPGDMHCYCFPGNQHEILYCLSGGSVLLLPSGTKNCLCLEIHHLYHLLQISLKVMHLGHPEWCNQKSLVFLSA